MEFQQRQLNSEERGLDRASTWKRIGMTTLGFLGITYGTEFAAAGALFTALAPSVALGPAFVAVGAAAHYGAYRAFKHEATISDNPEAEKRESRLSKIGRYIGGAAVTYGGAVLMGSALASPLSLLSAGVFVGGAFVAGYGMKLIKESFEVARQPAEAPAYQPVQQPVPTPA